MSPKHWSPTWLGRYKVCMFSCLLIPSHCPSLPLSLADIPQVAYLPYSRLRTMRSVAYVVAALAAGANTVATSSLSLMESLREVPSGWSSVGKPLSSQRLQFRIAMSSPSEGLFEQTLYQISDPSHRNYGKHLKRDELKAMLRPHPEATESVMFWLQNAGVASKDIVDDGEWINFMATVQEAEGLFDTTFDIYRSTQARQDKIRTLHYSVPENLHAYINMIQPTTRFGQMRAERDFVFDYELLGEVGSAAINVTACNATITPACLKSLYNIPEVPKFKKNKKIGFAAFNNFLEQYPRFNDLATFEAEYAPYAVNQSFDYRLINGGLLNQTSTDDSGEANLDVVRINSRWTKVHCS